MLGWLWSVILQSSPCSVRGGDRGSVGSPLNLPPIFCHAQNPRSLGGDVASDGDFLIFEGNRYSRKGFLFKSFAMSAVVRVPERVALMAMGSGEARLSPHLQPWPQSSG